MKTEPTAKPPPPPPPPATPPASPPATPPAAAPPHSPPSPTSSPTSPTHEFSFTISLHLPKPAGAAPPPDFDPSPADDLFFHGRLLPLHLLPPQKTEQKQSNLPQKTEQKQSNLPKKTEQKQSNFPPNNFIPPQKPKPFPSFLRKWLRRIEPADGEKRRLSKSKKAAHFARLWRKYTSFVDPLLFFNSGKLRREVRRTTHSFSGEPSRPDGGWKRRWRGGSSAPASMRTSPANSGLLVPPPPGGAFSSSDESTMEELQNAIQAAIAHCKNSVAGIMLDVHNKSIEDTYE